MPPVSHGNDASSPRRRYLRYRLRTLLILPLAFAAGWWWVTWPERTAKKFVGFLADGNIAAARAMIDGPQPSAAFERIVTCGKFKFQPPAFKAATWGESLAALRRFQFGWELPNDDGDLGPFVARRNRIRLGPPANPGSYAVVFQLGNVEADFIVSRLADVFPDSDEHRVRADDDEHRIVVAASERALDEIRPLIHLAEQEAGR